MKGTRLLKSEISSSGPVLAPPPILAANSGSADWILPEQARMLLRIVVKGIKDHTKPRRNHSFIYIFLTKIGSER
jgi:hypothetical protein